MAGKKIIAVVVTYNRRVLLLECVRALLSQSYPLHKLLLIDNASTDGTGELLKSEGILDNPVVDYRLMDRNTGGSGGFYEGLRLSKDMDADWVWIMDDDTIPEKTSLEKLVDKAEQLPAASFFASCVHGMENEPMNVPVLDNRVSTNGYPDWYVDLDRKLVKIKKATFVSLLINSDAIRKCGLPCRDYFIWADDYEYTERLTTYYGKAYLVGDSWVLHKRLNAKSIDIDNEQDRNRIRNYHHYYRNNLVNIYVYQGSGRFLKQSLMWGKDSFKKLKDKNGLLRFKTIQKGIWEAYFQAGQFKKYIMEQIGR